MAPTPNDNKDAALSTTNATAVAAISNMDLTKVLGDLASAVNITNVIASNLEFITPQFKEGPALKNFIADFNMMETAVTNLALKFGGARGFADEIKKSIDLATPSVIALGGSMEDVVNIQKGVVGALQTQTILDKESYKDLYAIGNLVNDGTKTTAESTKTLVSQFVNAGYSLYDISKQMGDIVNMAREIGVSTAAVYKQLSDNMSKLNLYNFEGGVQGMGKMAAEAASLRLNMSDTLGFAEKVFKPEDAIQMAADMQRLGVQVSSLLDPYKLMDMSRNHPEELQKSVYEAAAALTKFDEKTGRTIVQPGELGRLRELAETFKMSSEQVAQMGINYADMQRKMETIKFSSVVDEKDQKFVAGLSQLKDGKYQVNVGLDSSGQQVMKEVSNLTKQDLDKIKQMEGDKKKSPAELQVEANNALVNIVNNTNALKGLIPRQLAASPKATQFMKNVGEVAMPKIKELESVVGIKNQPGGYIDISEFQHKVSTLGDTVVDNIMAVVKGDKGIEGAFTDTADVIKSGGQKIFGKFMDFWDKEVSSISSKKSAAPTSISNTTTTNATNTTNTTPTTTNVNTTNTTNSTNTTPIITTPTSTTTTTPSLFDTIYNALNDVFKRFENPGTLKVTLYGDKAGLINAVSSSAEMTSTAMGQNINDLKTSITKTGPKPEKTEVVKVETPKTVEPAEKQKIEIVTPKTKEVKPIESKETTDKKLTSTITVPPTIYTTPDILKGGIPKIPTETTKPKTTSDDVYVNIDKIIKSSVDLLNKSIKTVEGKETTVTPIIDLSKISDNLKSILSEKTLTPIENKVVEKTIETRPTTDIFTNFNNVTKGALDILNNYKPLSVGVKETPLVPKIDLTSISDNLKTILSEKTPTPIENKVVEKTIETKVEKGIVPGMKSDDRLKMMLPYLEKFDVLDKLADLYMKGSNVNTPLTKLVGPTSESVKQTNEIISVTKEKETPTTDIFTNFNKLTDSTIDFLNKNKPVSVGKETPVVPKIDLTSISDNLKTILFEKTMTSTPEIKRVENPVETKPTIDIFTNFNKLTDSTIDFLNKNKPETKIETKEIPAISPVVDLSKISDNLKDILQKNKVEKVEKIETKEKESPFNINVKLPDYLKNIVSEKTSEKTNVMTTVSLTEKMSELTKEFFNKENKEKTNILSPNISYDMIKTAIGEIKPESPKVEKEVKMVTEPLVSNIKLEDFTKGISNVTNIESKEVKSPTTVDFKMTDEIKDLLGSNKTDTFIERLTTTPSIFTPTVKLPESLMNFKPEELKSTTLNKELTSTNTKTTEIFNDISKIYNPNSLITKLDDTNKDLFSSLTKLTTPVKEETIVNVKEPVTTTPITNVVPPITNTTIPSVVRTETEKVTKEMNHKHEFDGSIKIDVPNMPNLELALNNPQFISNLQEKIVKHVVDGKILRGSGNYNYNG